MAFNKYIMFLLWLKGLIVGLTVSIPVGPVGLFCLDNTVSRGRTAGMSCATGMVLADIFSACVMIAGLGLFYETLMAHETLVRILTGVLFAALGVSIIMTRSSRRKAVGKRECAGLWLTSFILSVSPATFALMIYLFPALNLVGAGHTFLIVSGVALGSALWASVIIGGGGFIKRCLGQDISRFKVVVGCFLGLFGTLGIVSALMHLA